MIIYFNCFTGVEPLSYYFINGFLNFNFVFFLALVAIPFAVSVTNLNNSSIFKTKYLFLAQQNMRNHAKNVHKGKKMMTGFLHQEN